ncbi:MAG: hypothetical protein Kow00121_44580 [Elainellaceae cyanobacterium]
MIDKHQLAGVEALEATDTFTEPKMLELGNPLSADSQFYIEREVGGAERSTIEAYCTNAILAPGALIRIKGSKRMGKTSLVIRILHQVVDQHQTIFLSFRTIEPAVLQDPDQFLQWFCRQVTLGLQLPDRLADYWDDLFGSTISCKSYFEEYLLAEIAQPIVLALDDVDRLFAYPDLADEFFGLLRAWHEDTKSRDIWKKLRLIVAHSTEVYIPLNIHKSPFNVGIPIELPALTQEQVQTLAERYQLRNVEPWIQPLITLVGGQPYLVQMALSAAKDDSRSLEQLLQSATIGNGIYAAHLQQQWQTLQQNPALVQSMAEVVHANTPVEIDRLQAFKLQSLGLVRLQGVHATPSCALYAHYFKACLASDWLR